MSVNASSTGYLPLGSPFSLAFFCFCCMISASLKYNFFFYHIHIQYDALCNSMHLLVVIIFRCCTFAYGQLLRVHPHFSSLWDDRFASWHSSDGQVHADFPLQGRDIATLLKAYSYFTALNLYRDCRQDGTRMNIKTLHLKPPDCNWQIYSVSGSVFFLK